MSSSCTTMLCGMTSSQGAGYGSGFCRQWSSSSSFCGAAKQERSCTMIKATSRRGIGASLSTLGLQYTSSTHTSPVPLHLPSSEEVASLIMPSLHCPFPSLVHPDYEAVKQQCDNWIAEVAHPPSAAARCFLLNCLLPRLVCRFIPHAISRARLVHVIKMIAWLMIADDDDDHPDALGSNYASTAHRARLVMAILLSIDCNQPSFGGLSMPSVMSGSTTGVTSKCWRMLQALAELWEEMRVEMRPCLRARFTSTMADYFEGLKVYF